MTSIHSFVYRSAWKRLLLVWIARQQFDEKETELDIA